MPAYTYRCSVCSTTFDRSLPLACYQEPQTCVCGATAERVLEPVGVILKGDGWPGKNLKIRGQMAQKNRRLSGKAKDAPTAALVPNVGGDETGTWAEAQKKAASEGKDTSTYTPLVQQEHAR